MMLYKDYKDEQERLNQEKADREAMSLNKEVVIIYERENGLLVKIRNILILVCLLVLLALAIVFFAKVVYMEV